MNAETQFLFQELRGLLKGCNFPALADEVVGKIQQAHEEALKAVQAMEDRKDAAYLERNEVVAALAQCFPSGIAKTAIEGGSEDWHGCVYIDLPTGQASWHYHDSQAYMFKGLSAYTGQWDGHTTEQKYERLARLPTQVPPTLLTLLPTMCSAFRTTVVQPLPDKTLCKMEFDFSDNKAMIQADNEWLAAARKAGDLFDPRAARQINHATHSETFFPTQVVGPEETQS